MKTKKKGPKKGAQYNTGHPFEFGQRLFELRKKKGLSQEELAEKMGTTKRMISHWEREVEKPFVDVIQKISTTLGVTEKYFLGASSPVTNENQNVSRAFLKRIDRAKKLSPESQKSIQDFIDTLSKLEGVT